MSDKFENFLDSANKWIPRQFYHIAGEWSNIQIAVNQGLRGRSEDPEIGGISKMVGVIRPPPQGRRKVWKSGGASIIFGAFVLR